MGLIANLANSTYHAMQLTMNRRFTQGFYFTTSYTLSKSLDYVSSLNETGSGPSGASGETDLAQNPFNLRAEHGPSIFDARHRWVMSASWELPIFKNSSGVAKAVLAGWQLNGIANFSSGTPFTVYDSVDFSQSGNAPEVQGFPANRPNAVSNPNKGPQTVERWFDISAFQRLDPVTSGGQIRQCRTKYCAGAGFQRVGFVFDEDLCGSGRAFLTVPRGVFQFSKPCEFLHSRKRRGFSQLRANFAGRTTSIVAVCLEVSLLGQTVEQPKFACLQEKEEESAPRWERYGFEEFRNNCGGDSQ